jgi:hypothetical protein
MLQVHGRDALDFGGILKMLETCTLLIVKSYRI